MVKKSVVIWTVIFVVAMAAGIFYYTNGKTTDKYCGGMSLSEAKEIASAGCKNGTLDYSPELVYCNEGTNTWWIGFKPDQENKLCNPACVVNVLDKSADVNWRCTGVLPQ